MKNFLFKTFIFIIPIAVVFMPPLFVFIISGELIPPDRIYNLQKDALFQSAFTISTEKPYKISATIKTDPEIITLGLSRVLTFRKDFFREGITFYNAGRGIYGAEDLVPFLEKLSTQNRLKIVILDLSGIWNNVPRERVENIESVYDMIRLLLSTGWRQAYLDYIQKKFSLTEIIDNRKDNSNIGLAALIHQTGYRKDGSLDRGSSVGVLKGIEVIEVLAKQSQKNITSLEKIYSPQPSHLSDIEKFLTLARERNIYVIGYLSPFSEEIYKGIVDRQDDFGRNFRTAPIILSALFKKQGFSFYDLRNLKTFDSSNIELYDADHPTEKGTLRLLFYVASREPQLRKYVDLSTFKQKIDKESI
jgi:hypothetical protein